MKRLAPFIAGAAAGAAIATICTTKLRGHNNGSPSVIINDTVTVTDTVIDTLRLTAIRPIKTKSVGSKKIAALDSLGDSCIVDIPLKQHVFEDDSANWRAVISGTFVTLDTMEISRPTLQQKNFIYRQTSPKLHIGPSVGLGYDGHRLSPYIGITLTYSLISL